MIIIVLKHVITDRVLHINAADITVEELGQLTSTGYEIIEYQHNEKM